MTMNPTTVDVIALILGLATIVIISIGRNVLGRYTLNRNPDSVWLPLFFDRLLKTRWKVIEWVSAILWAVALFLVGLPAGFVLLLLPFVTVLTVSFTGRMLGTNIWNDDKPPSIVAGG
jgi:hypothetical protein